jgi:hypothetical protein
MPRTLLAISSRQPRLTFPRRNDAACEHDTNHHAVEYSIIHPISSVLDIPLWDSQIGSEPDCNIVKNKALNGDKSGFSSRIRQGKDQREGLRGCRNSRRTAGNGVIK